MNDLAEQIYKKLLESGFTEGVIPKEGALCPSLSGTMPLYSYQNGICIRKKQRAALYIQDSTKEVHEQQARWAAGRLSMGLKPDAVDETLQWNALCVSKSSEDSTLFSYPQLVDHATAFVSGIIAWTIMSFADVSTEISGFDSFYLKIMNLVQNGGEAYLKECLDPEALVNEMLKLNLPTTILKNGFVKIVFPE